MQQPPQYFARELDAIGVTITKSMRSVLDTLSALQACRDTNHAEAARLDSSGDRLTAGNAAAKLKEHATCLVVADKVATAYLDFESTCNAAWYEAVRSAHASLFGQLRERFAEHAAVVQTAGLYFGSDATDGEVLAGGVEAVAVWQKLSDATGKLILVRSCRVQLAEIAHEGEQSVEWYIDGAADAEALDLARRVYAEPGDVFLNLAHAGFTLRLNSPAEAAKVAAGAQAVSDARETEAREAALAEHRASWPAFATSVGT